MLTICTTNIVLLLYSLIALAKYFIFPQLTAMHYGYSSPLQLLLSPVTMVKSLLLLLVGLPSTLLYRFPQEHVVTVAVNEMVRLANICAGIHFFESLLAFGIENESKFLLQCFINTLDSKRLPLLSAVKLK